MVLICKHSEANCFKQTYFEQLLHKVAGFIKLEAKEDIVQDREQVVITFAKIIALVVLEQYSFLGCCCYMEVSFAFFGNIDYKRKLIFPNLY